MTTAGGISLPEELERDILSILGLDALPAAWATPASSAPPRPLRTPRARPRPAVRSRPVFLALARSRAASVSLGAVAAVAVVGGGAVLIRQNMPDLLGVSPARGPTPSPRNVITPPADRSPAPGVIARAEPLDEPMSIRPPVTAAGTPDDPVRQAVPDAPAVRALVAPKSPSARNQRSYASLRKSERQRRVDKVKLVNPPARAASAEVAGKRQQSGLQRVELVSGVASGALTETSSPHQPVQVEQFAGRQDAAPPSPVPTERVRRTRSDSLDDLRTLRRQW